MQRAKYTKSSIFIYCPACKTIHCIDRAERLISDPYGDSITVWGGSIIPGNGVGGCHFWIKDGLIWYVWHQYKQFNNKVFQLPDISSWGQAPKTERLPGYIGASVEANTHFWHCIQIGIGPKGPRDILFIFNNKQP